VKECPRTPADLALIAFLDLAPEIGDDELLKKAADPKKWVLHSDRGASTDSWTRKT
jgi:hypothetical protein